MKPATRASRYATIKKLGEGGYGKALLVRNKDDKHLYVMKQVKVSNLSAKDKHAALHEATLLSAFNSPYIVKFTESFEEKGVLYIVMEYADGGDLCQMMERRKRSKKYFTEDEVLYYFIQISLALKYLHDRKVLHRDIKAQNVFLMKTGQVKLGDFGIAKVLQNTMALAMSQIGTPYYLSPEICNNRKYNSKTDIWSLGCMLYEMCTFTHPFDAKDVKSLMKRIIQAKYVPISSSRYSPELQALLSRLLNKNPNERPSINQVLGFPFIKIQLSNYLDKTIQNEMNHTILHGFKFDNQRPVNHPPEAPPKPVQQPPAQQKKAPAQPPRPQQKPFTPQIQQHPPNPAPANAKPQTPGVRQSNNRNLPAKPQQPVQKPAVQQNAAKPQQPVQKPAVQQNHPQQPQPQQQQQQKHPVQQPKAQPQQQNQVQHQRVVQQNQKVVVPTNQPQQAHSNNGNAKPPSNQCKRAAPPSARGSNAKKPANQQPKKTREEQIAEFKKYAAEREAKRLQQEREAQSKKNDEAEKKLSQQVAEAEAKVAGKKDSDPDKEKLKAKLEQIKALKKWSEERERIKKEQEAKRKQEEEEKQKKQQEEADRIKKEAEKIKQKRDDQKVKERQELKQKQQQRLQAAAAYRKQQDEEERQRLRHLEEEDEMQQQLESLMPDESKLPSWVNKPKLSAEEEELQMLSRKPLNEMSNEERARFAQLQRHEMRRNKEKGTAGSTETNDEDMNEYDEIDEDRQNEIQYEMAMSMNQALNLPEVNEDDKAEDGFESEDEDGKGPNPEMVLWESSDSEEDEEEDFPGPA